MEVAESRPRGGRGGIVAIRDAVVCVCQEEGSAQLEGKGRQLRVWVRTDLG